MVFTRVARYSIIGNYYREFYYLFRSTGKIGKKTVKLNVCASSNKCFFKKRMILYFLHKIYDRLLLENSHCLCWRLKAGSNCPQFQRGLFIGDHRILPPGERRTLMWPLRMDIPKDLPPVRENTKPPFPDARDIHDMDILDFSRKWLLEHTNQRCI